MQHHLVIGYDTELKKWFVEGDPTSYFPGGSIFSLDRSNDPDFGYDGWFHPEEGSEEELLDAELYSTLGYIVDTFPIPQEV